MKVHKDENLADFLARFRKSVTFNRKYETPDPAHRGIGVKYITRDEVVTRVVNFYLNYKGKRNAQLARKLIEDRAVMAIYQEKLKFYEGDSHAR